MNIYGFPVFREYTWNSLLDEEYKEFDGIIGYLITQEYDIPGQFADWENKGNTKQELIEFSIKQMKESVEKLIFDNNTGLLKSLPEKKGLYLYYSILQIWPEYSEYDYILNECIKNSNNSFDRIIHGYRLNLFHKQLKRILDTKHNSNSIDLLHYE